MNKQEDVTQQILNLLYAKTDVHDAVYDFIKTLREDGLGVKSIIDIWESIRNSEKLTEQKENVILEMLDYLTGWCRSDLSLK